MSVLENIFLSKQIFNQSYTLQHHVNSKMFIRGQRQLDHLIVSINNPYLYLLVSHLASVLYYRNKHLYKHNQDSTITPNTFSNIAFIVCHVIGHVCDINISFIPLITCILISFEEQIKWKTFCLRNYTRIQVMSDPGFAPKPLGGEITSLLSSKPGKWKHCTFSGAILLNYSTVLRQVFSPN